MIGVDSHKRTHTVVALDDVGRRLGVKTVRTNSDGHFALVQWADHFADGGQEVSFALEDCRHLTRRLESDLLTAGLRVVRVPTRLMATARRSGREPGKSDPIDAEAVAIAALRHPGLPIAELDGPAREVKLLCDHRRDLVKQRTRIAAQVRWHLHELDPDLQVPSRGLRHQHVLRGLLTQVDDFEGIVARLTRDLLERCAELNAQIAALEKGTACLGAGAGAEPAGDLWLRGAVRRRHRRRERRGASLPEQGRVRPVHRHRPRARVVRLQSRQGPTQPWRQPVDELGPSHDRRHPSPRRRTRPGLPGQATRTRQRHSSRPAAAAPAPVRRRVHRTPRRPACRYPRPGTEPAGASGLT